MGLFDIFSTADQEKAAQDQISGLNKGYSLASGNINQGIGAINSSYTAALQPYLQNYGQAQAGVTQLGNALGLNGAQGNAAALQQLRSTPGYGFQQQSMDDTVNAQAAASGNNASGNQLLALNKVNQGLADSTSNNYISQLQPFLGASNAAAGGIAGVNMGQGNAIAGQQDMLAQLGYQTQTGIGNANANADLAGLQASGNFWNMLGGLGGMKTSGGGTVGGNAISGLGSMLGSVFSDERLKEDVETVGELFDGQPVYKYRYIGDPKWQIGLMAQDVEKIIPEAVHEIGGFKAVNYNVATGYAADLSRFLEAA
jgi:hypothetical protein